MITGIKCTARTEAEEEIISIEDCLKCAATYQNPCEYSYPLLYSMLSGEKKERPEGITPSMLTKCPRQLYIEKNSDYAITIPYYQARGTALHSLVEKYKSPNSIVEQRFGMKINGREFSGQVDELIPGDDCILIDYKSSKQVPRNVKTKEGYIARPFSNHVPQINSYIYILAHQQKPIIVKKAYVIYMSLDSVKKAVCQIWDKETIESYLKLKLGILWSVLEENALVPYEKCAGSEDYGWACNGYCDHKAACDKLYREELKAQIMAEMGLTPTPAVVSKKTATKTK